ncbi:MAG TPA: hypothetical protein VIN08_14905 [Ohtaekwangia sp.]|uniref:hypothetical protein n=1 Tax=Ohtaekwangia sp. TaxID=2066019 RepID=UPI002F94A2B8
MIATQSSQKANSKWEAQKMKLKKQFPKLSDADLDFDEIKKTEMLAALEFKLSIPSEELRIIIETL